MKMSFVNIYDLDEFGQFVLIGRVNISRRKECPSCYGIFVKEKIVILCNGKMGKLGNSTDVRVVDAESFLEAECD